MGKPKYPVADLISGAVQADLSELTERIDEDKRAPFSVCEVRRTDGPTPCWWPFCNCGAK